MDKMKQYLNRILPVVGNHLRDKSVMFLNLELTHTICEAFGRSGVKKFVLRDTAMVEKGSQMLLSYGIKCLGKKKSEAVEEVLRKHNTFESGWTFGPGRTRPDIIIAAGKGGEALSLAKEHKVPAVVFKVFSGRDATSAISVFDARNGLEWSLFDEGLPESENIGRLDFLETADLAGNLAKAVLLRGTEFERQDIEEIVYAQKRNNIVRGRAHWPWYVLYGSAASRDRMLSMINGRGAPEEYGSENGRLMILGCGTGSLLAGEALNFYKEMLLVDCKSFSVYNPVRQLCTTKDIGKRKALALQKSLISRLPGTQKPRRGKFGKTLSKGDCRITSINLKVEEKAATRLKDIVRWFHPDVAVVAMGQTRNENFIATRILREHNIPHVVPACFPLATHFKHIVVDGQSGPCYSCLQGTSVVDVGKAPELTEEQRDMFYGATADEGTQPATIFETRPSAHSALRLALELKHRHGWFSDCLGKEENVFVCGNSAIQTEGEYLYGVRYPGQMVVYSAAEMVGVNKIIRCLDCGREYQTKFLIE